MSSSQWGPALLKKADVRFIAATNRDLKTMVDQGTFQRRPVLPPRKNVFPIHHSLRCASGRDDIPNGCCTTFCDKPAVRPENMSTASPDESLEMLINYVWPGRNAAAQERGGASGHHRRQSVLECQHLSDHWDAEPDPTRDEVPESLDALKAAKQNLLDVQFGEIEKAFLKKALSSAGGNITQAARLVGMQRSNFSTLMKKHALSASSGPSTTIEDGRD